MKYYINDNTYTKEELLKYASLVDLMGLPPWKKKIFQFIAEYLSDEPVVKIQTSGTTGSPKILEIEKMKMKISAAKTAEYFKFKKEQDVLLVLPVDYIAAKMMIVRAFEHQLNLVYYEPKVNFLTAIKQDEKFYFCPITPMQAKVCLQDKIAEKKMKNIQHILLGGAPVDAGLFQLIKKQTNSYYHSYGMTETLTHIAIKKLNGNNNQDFQLLENIRISKDERSCLVVDAPEFSNQPIITNDLVDIKNNNSFEWLGRFDNIINSGGIKIVPEQIEQQIQYLIQQPFYISAIPDSVLGQKMILQIESEKRLNTNDLLNQIKQILPANQSPKLIKVVHKFNRTSSGKIIRT